MNVRLIWTIALLALLLAACGTPTAAGVLFHTADPTFDIVVPWQEVVTEQPACLIKGNISRQGERIYHVPGQLNYARTVIDPDQGEVCFATEEAAVAAGWRKALR